jgi:hypothetical protein
MLAGTLGDVEVGMNHSRNIIGYLLGGAVIIFGLVVIAAVLAGAVWLAVELLR